MKVPALYVALVHYPVINKSGALITTSVTNLDIHDIARSSRTFGVKGYFLVTPILRQHQLLGRILQHWESPEGQEYNPDRHEALSLVQVSHDLNQAQEEIAKRESALPLVAVTAARLSAQEASMADLKLQAQNANRPVLLVFGTGHGLDQSVLDQADVRLAGIASASEDGYNHLSVRSAVAIYLSRWALV